MIALFCVMIAMNLAASAALYRGWTRGLRLLLVANALFAVAFAAVAWHQRPSIAVTRCFYAYVASVVAPGYYSACAIVENRI